MPQFKTTYNILKKPDEDEAFEKKWFETSELLLPPSKPWDYKRKLKVEDVDYWEVLHEGSAGIGVYASWQPYAEFYMITTGLDFKNDARVIDKFLYHDRIYETFYGPGAQHAVKKRALDFGINLKESFEWVENDKLWLYETNNTTKKIYL